MTFLDFWKRSVEFFKKHWQLVVGFVVGIIVFLKLRPSPGNTTVGEIVKVETGAAKDVVKAEETFNQAVEVATEKAEAAHEQRVEEIKTKEEEAVASATQQVASRTDENRKGSLDSLANNLAASLGANVVEPQRDDK